MNLSIIIPSKTDSNLNRCLYDVLLPDRPPLPPALPPPPVKAPARPLDIPSVGNVGGSLGPPPTPSDSTPPSTPLPQPPKPDGTNKPGVGGFVEGSPLPTWARGQ